MGLFKISDSSETQKEGKGVDAVNVYRQETPPLRFVGIKYGDEDRVFGGFGLLWRKWFKINKFAPIDALCAPAPIEDGNAEIGLMRVKEGEPFEYWIGKFVKADSSVPTGYEALDFPESVWGIVWLKGKGGKAFGKESFAWRQCGAQGMQIKRDGQGAQWSFERYADRYRQKDEEGKSILDIGFLVQ